MVNHHTRRIFLRTAPLAAAVAFSATDTLALAADGGQSAGSAAPQPFQVFTAEKLSDAMKEQKELNAAVNRIANRRP